MNRDKIGRAISYLMEEHHADTCGHYGEPGYTQPERGIILCDWNDVPKGLAEWLEKCGFATEWSDEWTIDCENDKAYRTEPNSYHWEPSYIVTDDGGLLTPDDDPAEVIEECAVTYHHNVVRQVLPRFITPLILIEEGYEMFGDKLECGFFSGQNDNPAEVVKAALKEGYESAVIARDEVSQFYSKYRVWVRKDDDKENDE